MVHHEDDGGLGVDAPGRLGAGDAHVIERARDPARQPRRQPEIDRRRKAGHDLARVMQGAFMRDRLGHACRAGVFGHRGQHIAVIDQALDRVVPPRQLERLYRRLSRLFSSATAHSRIRRRKNQHTEGNRKRHAKVTPAKAENQHQKPEREFDGPQHRRRRLQIAPRA